MSDNFIHYEIYVHIIHTPFILQLEDLSDKVWANIGINKSWITFKLLTSEIRNSYQQICLDNKKMYIYNFLIDIFIENTSQSYALETVS
jgi:hypothetical protein